MQPASESKNTESGLSGRRLLVCLSCAGDWGPETNPSSFCFPSFCIELMPHAFSSVIVFIMIVLSADNGVILVFPLFFYATSETQLKLRASFFVFFVCLFLSFFLYFFLLLSFFYYFFLSFFLFSVMGATDGGWGRRALLRAKTALCRAVKQRVESDFEYNKTLENMQMLVLVKHMAIWNRRKARGI